MWILFSVLSALAAAGTATLSKIGLEKVDSNVVTAISGVVIALLMWPTVAFQGHLKDVRSMDGRSWFFVLATGVVTTLAYVFYFRALKMGQESRVAPIDRLSLVFAVLAAALFLKEKVTAQVIVGCALMAAGAITVALSK